MGNSSHDEPSSGLGGDVEHSPPASNGLRNRLAQRLFGAKATAVRVDHFVVLKVLEPGDFERVYLAYDLERDEKVELRLCGAHITGVEAQTLALTWSGQGEHRVEIRKSGEQFYLTCGVGPTPLGYNSGALGQEPETFKAKRDLLRGLQVFRRRCIENRALRRVLMSLALVGALIAATCFFPLASSDPELCDRLIEVWDGPASTCLDGAASRGGESSGWRKELGLYLAKGKKLHRQACLASTHRGDSEILDFDAVSACYSAAANEVPDYLERTSRRLSKGATRLASPHQGLLDLQACLDRDLDARDASVDSKAIEEELASAKLRAAFHDFPESLSHAQRALDRLGPGRHPRQLVRALIFKARALHAIGKPLQARKSVDLAYVNAQAQHDLSLRLKAAVLRSKIMVRQGLFEASVEAMRDARPLAEHPQVLAEAKFEYFSKACLVDRRDMNPCSSLQACLDAKELAQRESFSAIEKSELERRMAWIFFEVGHIDEAIALAETAQRRIREFVGEASALSLSADALHVSLMAEKLRVSGAKASGYETLQAQSEGVCSGYLKAFGPKSYWTTYAKRNLAEISRRAGAFERARQLYEELLEGVAADAQRYFTLVGYGKTLAALGRRADAKRVLQDALSEILEIERRGRQEGQNPQIPEHAEALLALSKLLDDQARAMDAAKEARDQYQALQGDEAQSQHRCAQLRGAKGIYGRELDEANQRMKQLDDLLTKFRATSTPGEELER